MSAAEIPRRGTATSRSLLLRASTRWQLAARLASALCSLLTLVVLTRTLSLGEFGFYATLTSLGWLLGVSDLGLGAAVTSLMAGALGSGREGELRPLALHALRRLSIAGLVIAIVTTTLALAVRGFGWLGASAVRDATARQCLVVFAIALGFGVPAGLGNRIQIGRQQGRASGVWLSIASLVTLGATSVAAAMTNHLLPLVAVTLLCPVLVLGAQTIWAVHALPSPAQATGVGASSALMRRGALFLVATLLSGISYELDTLVIANVLGAHQVARFATHAKLFLLINGFVGVVGAQLWPAMTHAEAGGDTEWVWATTRRALVRTTGAAAAASLVIVLVAPAAMRTAFGYAYRADLGLLLSCALWAISGAAVAIGASLMIALGHLRIHVQACVLFTAFNLLASVSLAHHIGLSGPILGSVLAQVLIGVWMLAFLSRQPRGGVRVRASLGGRRGRRPCGGRRGQSR